MTILMSNFSLQIFDINNCICQMTSGTLLCSNFVNTLAEEVITLLILIFGVKLLMTPNEGF